MSAREKPVCQDVLSWLRANLGAAALGALTGTDHRALAAAVHIVTLYTYSGDDRALQALGPVVRVMQERTRYLAYHAIAHVMDWDDRARVWQLAQLPAPVLLRGCQYEPAGTAGVA